MSVFNIKLKTKAGNDIKKKEIMTCIFRLNFKRNTITKKITAEYTYRIIFSRGIIDSLHVLEIKNSQIVTSIEDLTLKVMLNLCHIIGKASKDKNLTPDIVLFMSPDLRSEFNESWRFLNNVLEKPNKNEKFKIYHPWDTDHCEKYRIKKEELDLLRSFVELNSSTMFMSFDPNRDIIKYAKTLKICEQLQERIDRQITDNSNK